MFRKKPDYGDLCEILNVINRTQVAQNDINEETIDQIQKIREILKDERERTNLRLEGLWAMIQDLRERIEVLEAKKQTKKQTKKTKGK